MPKKHVQNYVLDLFYKHFFSKLNNLAAFFFAKLIKLAARGDVPWLCLGCA